MTLNFKIDFKQERVGFKLETEARVLVEDTAVIDHLKWLADKMRTAEDTQADAGKKPETNSKPGHRHVITFFGIFFNFRPDAHKILTQNLLDIAVTVTSCSQSENKVRISGYILEVRGQCITNAVVVRADTNMIHTGQRDGSIDVIKNH